MTSSSTSNKIPIEWYRCSVIVTKKQQQQQHKHNLNWVVPMINHHKWHIECRMLHLRSMVFTHVAMTDLRISKYTSGGIFSTKKKKHYRLQKDCKLRRNFRVSNCAYEIGVFIGLNDNNVRDAIVCLAKDNLHFVFCYKYWKWAAENPWAIFYLLAIQCKMHALIQFSDETNARDMKKPQEFETHDWNQRQYYCFGIHTCTQTNTCLIGFWSRINIICLLWFDLITPLHRKRKKKLQNFEHFYTFNYLRILCWLLHYNFIVWIY